MTMVFDTMLTDCGINMSLTSHDHCVETLLLCNTVQPTPYPKHCVYILLNCPKSGKVHSLGLSINKTRCVSSDCRIFLF